MRDYSRFGRRAAAGIVTRLTPDHPMRPRDIIELVDDLVAARDRLRRIDQELSELGAERDQIQRLVAEPSRYLAARLVDSQHCLKIDDFVLTARVDIYGRSRLEIRDLYDVEYDCDPERDAAYQSMVDTLYPPDEPAAPDAATADVGASDAMSQAAAEAVTDAAEFPTSDEEPTTELPAVAVLDEEAA